MASSIITVAIAYALCFATWLIAKDYVNKYCQDNEPIIWIWLDDDPEIGSKINVTDKAQYMKLALSLRLG